jgi:hypothetical protein
MEKLITFGRRASYWALFFLGWFFAIQWASHRWDRPLWSVLIAMTAAAGLFVKYLDRRSARQAEQAARAQRELSVLRLAETEGGRLTASLTAVRLGWPTHVALETLRALEDGIRVTCLYQADAVRVFEFHEVIHAPDAAPPGTPIHRLDPTTFPAPAED